VLVVFVVTRAVSAVCLVVLAALVVFDAQAERLTAGRTPVEFSARLEPGLLPDYDRITGIAHNAGDDLKTAIDAVAYGVDGIEIDVHSTGGELSAVHDAPLPFLEDLVFRGPSLQEAWNVARLRDTVLLHLKERSPAYLSAVHAFLATHRLRRVLLIFGAGDLARLRRDPALLRTIDGVSVRETLLTAGTLAWLKSRGLLTFAWTVNDEHRMNELIREGIDGLITERLDIMRLLGSDQEPSQ
jgi:glycerophosphoryl diester phosphodiesterase